MKQRAYFRVDRKMSGVIINAPLVQGGELNVYMGMDTYRDNSCRSCLLVVDHIEKVKG